MGFCCGATYDSVGQRANNCIVLLTFSRPECLWLCLESLRRARGIEKYRLYFPLNDDCHPDIPGVIKRLCQGLDYEIERRPAGWLTEQANGEAMKGAAVRSSDYFIELAEDEEVSADYLEMVEYCVSHFNDGRLLAVPGGYVLPPPSTGDVRRLVKSHYVSTVGTAIMAKPFMQHVSPYLNREYYQAEIRDKAAIAKYRTKFMQRYFPGRPANIALSERDYEDMQTRFGVIGTNGILNDLDCVIEKHASRKTAFLKKHWPRYERNIYGIDGILHRVARQQDLYSLIPMIRRVHEIGFYGTHYPFNHDIFLAFHALKYGELIYLCPYCEKRLQPDFGVAEYRCPDGHAFSMKERTEFKAIYRGVPMDAATLREKLQHVSLQDRVDALRDVIASGEIKALFRNVPFYEPLDPDHQWSDLYIGKTPAASFHLLTEEGRPCHCPQPIPIGELQACIGGAVAHCLCDGYLGMPRKNCIVNWEL